MRSTTAGHPDTRVRGWRGRLGRGHRVLGGLPAGRQEDRARPGPGGADRVPLTLVLLIIVFRGPIAAGLPLARGRPDGGRLVRRPAAAGQHHRGVDLLPQPRDHGDGPRSRHRLQAVRPLPVPGGAGSRAGHGGGRRADRRDRRAAPGASALLTWSVSLSALLVFPVVFLRSFAYAGIPDRPPLGGGRRLPASPPLLAVLGPRIDKWSAPRRPPRPVGGVLASGGRWGHAAAGPDRHRRHRGPAGARQPLPRRQVRVPR